MIHALHVHSAHVPHATARLELCQEFVAGVNEKSCSSTTTSCSSRARSSLLRTIKGAASRFVPEGCGHASSGCRACRWEVHRRAPRQLSAKAWASRERRHGPTWASVHASGSWYLQPACWRDRRYRFTGDQIQACLPSRVVRPNTEAARPLTSMLRDTAASFRDGAVASAATAGVIARLGPWQAHAPGKESFGKMTAVHIDFLQDCRMRTGA